MLTTAARRLRRTVAATAATVMGIMTNSTTGLADSSIRRPSRVPTSKDTKGNTTSVNRMMPRVSGREPRWMLAVRRSDRMSKKRRTAS